MLLLPVWLYVQLFVYITGSHLLMSNTPIYILFSLAAGLGTGLMYAFITLKRHQKKMEWLAGGPDDQISDSVRAQDMLITRVSRLETKMEEMDPRIAALESIGRMSVQKVGFTRFNPFKDTGGDNSFMLALLDRDNNGVLVSSLYMRDGMRMYGKAIDRGTSRHPLSEEEKKLLEETIQKN